MGCQKHVEGLSRHLKEDLDWVNVFEPNNALTLKIHGDVKNMLKDHQRALEDLDMANVF